VATQTFKVSKTGVEAIEVSREVPDNVDDPRWGDIVVNPSEDIHELALQALIVKCQAGARARLDQGATAVQAYVEAYKYGARTGGVAAPVVSAADAQDQAFTEDQLAFLRQAGMRVEAEAE
jgi:hypothetical protein